MQHLTLNECMLCVQLSIGRMNYIQFLILKTRQSTELNSATQQEEKVRDADS